MWWLRSSRHDVWSLCSLVPKNEGVGRPVDSQGCDATIDGIKMACDSMHNLGITMRGQWMGNAKMSAVIIGEDFRRGRDVAGGAQSWRCLPGRERKEQWMRMRLCAGEDDLLQAKWITITKDMISIVMYE